MPGEVISCRQVFSCLTISRTCLVSRASSAIIRARTATSGSIIAINSGSLPTISRTRAAKSLRLGVPSLIPSSRAIPRTTFSPCGIWAAHVIQHRASGHQERAPAARLAALHMHLAKPSAASRPADPTTQWPRSGDRGGPVRMICATVRGCGDPAPRSGARASLRSVLFGMVFIAAPCGAGGTPQPH